MKPHLTFGWFGKHEMCVSMERERKRETERDRDRDRGGERGGLGMARC